MTEQNAVKGILWMLFSGLCMVGVTAVVRYLGDDLPATQSAFLRFAWSTVFLAPVLFVVLRQRVTFSTAKLHLLRGVLHVGAVTCWFFAMARLPMAEVTAIGYLNPVLLTIGTALIFGEKLAARRIGAILVAMVGALIILRPGLREISEGHLAQIMAACFFASSYLIAKFLSRSVPAGQAVAILSLVVTICLAPLAWWVWVPVSLTQLLWLALVAVFASGGHYAMSKAFAAAPVATTQPVVFLQLVWASVVGWLFFRETVDPFVILGGGIIVAAVSYITWREAVLARRAAR